jgi:predicted phage terminase large subunit-like protein
MHVDKPDYSAILFRRTYADLALPGALMDRSKEWLQGTAAHWNERDKLWTFPSRATVSFGYLQHDGDKYRYQGAAFQYIGFDELTQFPEGSYTYLFSRLRRLQGSTVPLRMRTASNPGGEGHSWVYERFVVPGHDPNRVFLPAGLRDNPYIDATEYRRALAELDDITRAQLLEGAWVTDPGGKPFQREWWRGQNRHGRIVDSTVVGRWISWDTAFKDKESSDYSAYLVAELTADYVLHVRYVHREKLTFPQLPEEMARVATQYGGDGKLLGVLIEDKASGTSAFQTLAATAPEWLQQVLVAFQPKGSKTERASQASVWCKRGCVTLPEIPHSVRNDDAGWLFEFEQELFNFPDVQHDDRVDALSQVVLFLEHYLAEGWRGRELVDGRQ